MSEVEIAQLKNQVAQLELAVQKEQEKNIQLEFKYGELEKKYKAEVKPVYVTKERHIEKFSGKPTKSGQPEIEEWIQEVQSYLKSRNFSKSEQVDFILQHLGGTAKEDIQYRPTQVKEDPDRILDTLKMTFGSQETIIDLQEAFYTRTQSPGESLLEYSVVLMKMGSRIVSRDPTLKANCDEMLKGRFLEGLTDELLKRDLRKENENDPSLDFCGLREKALRWDSRKRAKSVTVHEMRNSKQASQSGDSLRTHSSGRLADKDTEIMSCLKAIQKQQEKQLEKIDLTEKNLKQMSEQVDKLKRFQKSKSGICRHFKGPKGCSYGDKCRFAHDNQNSQKVNDQGAAKSTN